MKEEGPWESMEQFHEERPEPEAIDPELIATRSFRRSQEQGLSSEDEELPIED